MLASAETALRAGNLSHLDLPAWSRCFAIAPGGRAARECGNDDGIIFFEGGDIFHAEKPASWSATMLWCTS